MSKIDKAKERLSLRPKDYTYSEAKYLLSQLGFEEFNKGKTSGSRVAFVNKNNAKIELHKPHPGNILKMYQVNKLLKSLKELEEI